MPKKKNGQTVSEVDPSFGPQMNIPNRAERKALLEELEKAHEQGREESIPGYGAYAEKFKALGLQTAAASSAVGILLVHPVQECCWIFINRC